MSLDILFPHLGDFRLLSYSRETKRLVLTCERVTPSAPCPVCGTAAHRIHSRYQRRVWDLSVQNVQVLLQLHVRKFYCDRPDCPRRIFTERLPQVTSPHGRFTFSLRQFLGQLGREQGGASAARSATLQGMQVTARAILRFMHALALPAITPPRIIGLDDWGATRSYICSCKNSRKEGLTWGSAPSAEPSLNQVRLGQCSRVCKDGHCPVRENDDC